MVLSRSKVVRYGSNKGVVYPNSCVLKKKAHSRRVNSGIYKEIAVIDGDIEGITHSTAAAKSQDKRRVKDHSY